VEILIAILIVFAVAIVPMVLYSLILWWFDRYEKEPFGLITAAFLWGAIPAVIFSLIAQILFDIPISQLARPGLESDLLGASVIAPFTEEPFKGLALLLLLLFFRHEIDGPLDGILYGGLIGFGFAATENVFYFFSAFDAQGLAGVFELSFFRALLFGLNHALFTGFTGLGIALAYSSPRGVVRMVAPIAGLGMGIALHGIHNTGATLAGELCWPLLISLFADWGGVLGLLGVIVWSSLRERAWITRYLAEEIAVGTLGRHDYEIVQSYWRRLRERLRVLFEGDLGRWRQLGRYYHLATELAFAKRRWAVFGQAPSAGLRIEQLRRELYELRKQL